MQLNELFEIEFPKTLIYSKQKPLENGVNFVSCSSKNNGVVGRVKKNPHAKLYPAGLITVPLKGSILSAHVQPEEFYVAHQIAVLTPKKKMSIKEKIFYSMCIERNKFNYSYERQADRTIKELKMPNNLPKWINNIDDLNYENIICSKSKKVINLFDKKWKKYKYSDIFEIERGYYNKRPTKKGALNFVSASRENNGVTDKLSEKVVDKIYGGNCITVVNNGESTTYAFYQKKQFTCSHDVNILKLKNKELNPYIAMFLIPLFRKEKYRFNYGRKWRFDRMAKSEIELPSNSEGNPDWEFMELFIKSLNFSKEIAN